MGLRRKLADEPRVAEVVVVVFVSKTTGEEWVERREVIFALSAARQGQTRVLVW